MSESFSAPTSAIIPAYVYRQYSFDATVQAFFSAQNTLSQEYLDWFNATPLSVYTSDAISGALLDWIGQGIYGIPRPVLSSSMVVKLGGYNSNPYNTLAYNTLFYSSSGSSTVATDDIYKRVMTWNLYKGDGQVFSMGWIKNRISRFVNGVAGVDFPVANAPPSITVSGSTFTIQSSNDPIYSTLSQCIANNVIALPFQYTFTLVNYLTNVSGVVHVAAGANWPTSSSGLPTGAVWSNSGVATVVGVTTPNPGAPAVLFIEATAQQLLLLTGSNLPKTNPGVGSGKLWNNSGIVSVA